MFHIRAKTKKSVKHTGLTQAAVGHHDVHVTATLLASLLAPALDADWLVGLHHVGNLELWVYLHAHSYTSQQRHVVTSVWKALNSLRYLHILLRYFSKLVFPPRYFHLYITAVFPDAVSARQTRLCLPPCSSQPCVTSASAQYILSRRIVPPQVPLPLILFPRRLLFCFLSLQASLNADNNSPLVPCHSHVCQIGFFPIQLRAGGKSSSSPYLDFSISDIISSKC